MARVPHMNFMDSLKKTLGSEFNSSRTENGALGFRSTGQKLLDLNFAVSSLRNQPDHEVAARFSEAFFENPHLAVKWLFYAADVREGMGERRLFRLCLIYLAERRPELVQALLPLVPEYTRWDNVLCLLDTKLSEQAAAFLKEQLTKDMEQLEKETSISLCAKWMPSANASSKKTRHLADILIQKFGITERQYRKLLSKLRSHLNLVETAMSQREWGSIRYEEVPSRANLIYNAAFLRNDEARRRSYLESLNKGEAKIHAGVLYPHDIVHRYTSIGYSYSMKIAPKDAGLEELWKALPKLESEFGTTLCVADGSGSMVARIGKTQVSCLEVANALAIYFAENCCGPFQDKYITFSATPQLVDLSKANSLKEKLEIALHYNEVANTNIEAVFDLILTTAIQNHLSKEELPQNILILSDMEFDAATCSTRESFRSPSPALFEEIKRRFLVAGYSMPRLVFWNLCSRTGTIPLTENACGVALLSGFSIQTLHMVQSGQLDPYQCLLEQINTVRYEPVEAVLNQFC